MSTFRSRSPGTLARRFLSRSPRLHRLASGVRRRFHPSWRARSVASHWDELSEAVEDGRHRGWLDCELIEREYIRPQISGDREIAYLEHFVRSYIPAPPIGRAASLGCGGGHLERILIAGGWARWIEGLDISPRSIALAEARAAEHGWQERTSYRLVDLEQSELEVDTYDVVFAKMSLHHFRRLEHVFDQVAASLLPNGFLVFNEYVGPSRLQWSDRQLELVNQAFRSLPRGIRSRARVAVVRKPIEEDVVARDPSEAVRSSEILAVIRERFEMLELVAYGGTVLQPLLDAVLPALDFEKAADRDVIRDLYEFEREALESGVIGSDFAFGVATPRTND